MAKFTTITAGGDYLESQIDVIAIDLGGYTADSRTAIFAMSAAPIQASYIGVLSTMGAKYYDYLVAGKSMIPKENQKYFITKVLL